MMLRMKEKAVEEEEEKSSSGCQSGWTMYLDQSYEPQISLPFRKGFSLQKEDEEDDEEEEEEDLSMVSDASSGPPHFHDQEDDHCYCGNGCFCCASSLHAPALARNGGKRRRVEAEQRLTQKQPSPSSLLDDTASSPIFSFSKNTCNATNNNKKKLSSMEDVLDFSCGFSATHYKAKSALQKHLGYLQSSAPVEPTSVCRNEGEKKLW